MRRLIIIVICLFAYGSAFAEQEQYVAPGHHEFHPWYQKMQLLNGWNCCDEKAQDCGPIEKYRDVSEDTTEVLLEDGKWYVAKTNKTYVDTPDGKAHVCRQPMMDNYGNRREGFHFYCVFLPRGTM